MFLHHSVVFPSIRTSSALPSSSFSSTHPVLQHHRHGRSLGGPGALIGDRSRSRQGVGLKLRVDEIPQSRKEFKSRFDDGFQGIGLVGCYATLKEEEFLTKAQQPSDKSSSSSSDSLSSSNGSADGHDSNSVSGMEGKSILWRKLAQNVNLSGVLFSARVIVKDRHLAIPHVSVPDISWIDWKALRMRGFEGVLFDKDNTLTAPYGRNIWPPLTESLEECRKVFGGRIALLSNSAGLYQYDPHGAEAKLVESRLGIPVIRHGQKKPAGNALAVSNYFGCDPSLLIMVGDRYFTDVVYGNSNGLLTIRPAPLTTREEPFMVKRVRRVEETLVDWWRRQGCLPPKHKLLDNPVEFIKDPGCW
ncbi:unnamed protein product [Calypogeia fissa]